MTQTMTFTATLSDAVKPAATASEGRPDPTAGKEEKTFIERKREFLKSYDKASRAIEDATAALATLEQLLDTASINQKFIDQESFFIGLGKIVAALTYTLWEKGGENMTDLSCVRHLLGLPFENEGGAK